MKNWTVEPEWEGETGFVVANGPSFVRPDLLAGRKKICVNSGWKTVPDSDFLFFSDQRWFLAYQPTLDEFAGRIVSCGNYMVPPHVLQLGKLKPPTLSRDPSVVTMSRTCVTGALNLLLHLGCRRAVVVGLDGASASDGRRHHHGVKYIWDLRPGSYQAHRDEFAVMAPAFAAAGLEIINATPGSAIDAFPICDLEDVL